MSTVDIVLALFILAGAFHGYKNGFIVSLFSFIAIVLGVLVGFKLMGKAMVFLAGHYNIDQKVLPYLAFSLIFCIVIISVTLLGNVVKSFINKSPVGVLDQGLGALLGLVKVTFLLSIMLWIADSLKIEFPEHWTRHSWLQPITANFAPKITNWISEILPTFKDVF